MSESVLNILNEILKVEGIEEAFSCFLVHRSSTDTERIAIWEQELSDVLRDVTQEQVEIAIRQYLSVAATCSYSRLELLMDLLESLVRRGTLGARSVCETIITCDKLQCTNQSFWVESFKLLHKIVDLVEYKGVREIMKVRIMFIIVK